jgi:hypothetical protein
MRKCRGEIIWRLTYQVDATTDKERPEPVILLLADKEGWQYLAEMFLRKAECPALEDDLYRGDPDDHWHLSKGHPGVNAELSHALEFRLGTITPRNRDDVLDKYQIQPPRRSDRDMRYLFRRVIRAFEKECEAFRRHMRRRANMSKVWPNRGNRTLNK